MEYSNFIASWGILHRISFCVFLLLRLFHPHSVHPSIVVCPDNYHTAMNHHQEAKSQYCIVLLTRGLYCSRAKKSDWCGMVYSCLTYKHTQNTRRSRIIHDEPLQCRRSRTTAAMVPHSRPRCVETLANVLCSKAMLLKLEYSIINSTY